MSGLAWPMLMKADARALTMDVAVAHRAATEIVRGTSDAKLYVRKLCSPSDRIVFRTAKERPQNVEITRVS